MHLKERVAAAAKHPILDRVEVKIDDIRQLLQEITEVEIHLRRLQMIDIPHQPQEGLHDRTNSIIRKMAITAIREAAVTNRGILRI
jgi:hypothetical protein